MSEEAATVAQTKADVVSKGPGTIQASPAITMIVWDAAETVREALHRARKRTGNPEMRSTAFGQVLAGLLEKRGMQIKPFAVGKLAEEAGIAGWEIIKRTASADAEYAGAPRRPGRDLRPLRAGERRPGLSLRPRAAS